MILKEFYCFVNLSYLWWRLLENNCFKWRNKQINLIKCNTKIASIGDGNNCVQNISLQFLKTVQLLA